MLFLYLTFTQDYFDILSIHVLEPLSFNSMLSEQVMESKRLIKCFLNYLRHDRTEVGALFDMLSIFLCRSRIDYSFLKEFYVIEVMTFLISNS